MKHGGLALMIVALSSCSSAGTLDYQDALDCFGNGHDLMAHSVRLDELRKAGTVSQDVDATMDRDKKLEQRALLAGQKIGKSKDEILDEMSRVRGALEVDLIKNGPPSSPDDVIKPIIAKAEACNAKM